MKNDKARRSDGMPADAWEMFGTKHKGIDILIELFDRTTNNYVNQGSEVRVRNNRRTRVKPDIGSN
jgi:hypothetical protein